MSRECVFCVPINPIPHNPHYGNLYPQSLCLALENVNFMIIFLIRDIATMDNISGKTRIIYSSGQCKAIYITCNFWRCTVVRPPGPPVSGCALLALICLLIKADEEFFTDPLPVRVTAAPRRDASLQDNGGRVLIFKRLLDKSLLCPFCAKYVCNTNSTYNICIPCSANALYTQHLFAECVYKCEWV